MRDEMRVWEEIAARAYAADGAWEGWDSDREGEASRKKTPEDEYIKVGCMDGLIQPHRKCICIGCHQYQRSFGCTCRQHA